MTYHSDLFICRHLTLLFDQESAKDTSEVSKYKIVLVLDGAVCKSQCEYHPMAGITSHKFPMAAPSFNIARNLLSTP